MASSKEYLDFILEQLSDLDDVRSRAMMGEYILYYRGKVFGGVYDDRLLVKPVPTALQMMPDAEMELPYDGAKEMILVDDVDNRQFLCKLVKCMWKELPEKNVSSCVTWSNACGKSCRKRKRRNNIVEMKDLSSPPAGGGLSLFVIQ